ncbi:hypothetical protein [Ruegeria sp. HKCCD7318]|nr:hypothetical protein [Ruegeria sp. HKCCD7318]
MIWLGLICLALLIVGASQLGWHFLCLADPRPWLRPELNVSILT